MPTYTYKCTDCETKYEQFFKVKEEKEIVECPSCGSHEHKKLMSAANIGGFNTSAVGSDYSLPQSSSPCANGMCGLN